MRNRSDHIRKYTWHPEGWIDRTHARFLFLCYSSGIESRPETHVCIYMLHIYMFFRRYTMLYLSIRRIDFFFLYTTILINLFLRVNFSVVQNFSRISLKNSSVYIFTIIIYINNETILRFYFDFDSSFILKIPPRPRFLTYKIYRYIIFPSHRFSNQERKKERI